MRYDWSNCPNKEKIQTLKPDTLEKFERALYMIVEEKMNYNQVARQLGVSREYIRQFANMAGIAGVRSRTETAKRISEKNEHIEQKKKEKLENEKKLADLVNGGMSIAKAATAMNIPYSRAAKISTKQSTRTKFSRITYTIDDIEKYKDAGKSFREIAIILGATSELSLRAWYRNNKEGK